MIARFVSTVAIVLIFCAGGNAAPLEFKIDDADENENRDVISAVAYLPDGLTIAAAYGRFSGMLQQPLAGQAILWNAKTGRRQGTLQGHLDGVSSLAISANGQIVATGGYDGGAIVWEASGRRKLKSFLVPNAAITSVALSPDGKTLAAGLWTGQDRERNDIKLWDVRNGRELAKLHGHMQAVTSVQFHPDGVLIASGCKDGTTKLWDLSKDEAVATIGLGPDITDTKAKVTAVAFSPQGRTLAIAGEWDTTEGDEEPLGVVKVVDATRNKVVHNVVMPEFPIKQALFSRDGRMLVVAGREAIRVLDADTMKEMGSIEGSGPIALSPDGKQIVVRSGDATLKALPFTVADESGDRKAGSHRSGAERIVSERYWRHSRLPRRLRGGGQRVAQR